MLKFRRYSFVTLMFLMVFNPYINSQSSDKYIKIVGNAKTEINAEGISVTLLVSEIQPNDYRQVRFKPIETVFQNLVTNLTKLGFKETDLKRDIKSMASGSYQTVKNEKYVLILADVEQLSKLMRADLEGVAMQEVKYLFKAPSIEAEESLAIDAIKDAERKAKRIAKEIGKKVGKIINIEDKSNGSLREMDETKSGMTDKVISKFYKVNVTFELND